MTVPDHLATIVRNICVAIWCSVGRQKSKKPRPTRISLITTSMLLNQCGCLTVGHRLGIMIECVDGRSGKTSIHMLHKRRAVFSCMTF